MSESSVFRQYAEEAMREASKATSETDRRALGELACTWAQAALVSDRMFGSSFVSSQTDDGEAKPLIRS
jgi:hypothetical protein